MKKVLWHLYVVLGRFIGWCPQCKQLMQYRRIADMWCCKCNS